jgi:hypothetical protein
MICVKVGPIQIDGTAFLVYGFDAWGPGMVWDLFGSVRPCPRAAEPHPASERARQVARATSRFTHSCASRRMAPALLLVLACSATIAPPSVATASPGLSVENSAHGVQIEFGPVATRAESGSHVPLREGSFTLLLHNASRVALRPRLTLDPAKGAPVLRLHLFRQRSPTPFDLRSSGAVPTIAPGSVGRVSLLVAVPASSDPDSLDGTLVLNSVLPSYKGAGQPVLLPISAAGLDLPGVVVAPSAVTLHTTTWWPVWGSSAPGKTAPFELRGLGSDALLADRHLLAGRAVLHSDNGHSVVVRVQIETASGGRPQPVVHVLGRPYAGSYTGTLPLSASADAPTLSVTVLAHDAIVWALAAVGLGTALGGLLPLLGARARRRNLLRAYLQGVLIDYFAAAKNDKLMEWTALSKAIGSDERPWTSTEWVPIPRLRGAAGLFSSIRSAQSDAELAQAQTEVGELSASVARWLELEPDVHALDEIYRTPMPAINGIRWETTGTRRDSQYLLSNVEHNDPRSAGIAEKAQALQVQRVWHSQVAGAWQQLATSGLDVAHTGELLAKLQQITFATALAGRTADEWDKLRAALEDFLSDLKAARPSGELNESAPMAKFIEELVPTEVPPPARVRHALGVAWSPIRLIGTPLARGVRAVASRLPGSTTPSKLIARAQRQGVLLSIVAASGAVLAYVLPVYTDTWGTLTDYLTAVGAGFGAQAIVRWAALPIFESRAPSPPPAGAPGGR